MTQNKRVIAGLNHQSGDANGTTAPTSNIPQQHQEMINEVTTEWLIQQRKYLLAELKEAWPEDRATTNERNGALGTGRGEIEYKNGFNAALGLCWEVVEKVLNEKI